MVDVDVGWKLFEALEETCKTHIIKMAAPASAYKDRQFLAVIGDEVNLPFPPLLSHANQYTPPPGLSNWSALGWHRGTQLLGSCRALLELEADETE